MHGNDLVQALSEKGAIIYRDKRKEKSGHDPGKRGDIILISIVILTLNQLDFTKDCLESIRTHTAEPFELILVDNGSTDGTLDYLRNQPDVVLIENGENKGFAKGCNQGYERSTGDYIMFLNNDTVVTADWMTNLLRVLDSDERIGMVGPITNYSSGHQRIAVPYTDMKGLHEFAKHINETYAGMNTDVRRLVGFCMLTRRSVLEEVGVFDEIYGLGNYEDDDLCLRLLRGGYGMRVVLDSFIHHIGHATHSELPNNTLAQLLQKNAEVASQKWGSNIHNLIYAPSLSVTACLVVLNAEATLRHTLDSLTDDVDDIIVIDLGSTDATAEIAQSYPVQWFPLDGTEEHASRLAFDEMTSDYVLWLYQADVLSIKDIRILRAQKLSTDGKPDMIPLPFQDGLNKNEYLAPLSQRFLILRELAEQKLATIVSGIEPKA